MNVKKTVKSENRPVYSSVDELARELGISRQAAYRELNLGTIPAIRMNRRFVIPRTAIQEWLRSAGQKTK